VLEQNRGREKPEQRQLRPARLGNRPLDEDALRGAADALHAPRRARTGKRRRAGLARIGHAVIDAAIAVIVMPLHSSGAPGCTAALGSLQSVYGRVCPRFSRLMAQLQRSGARPRAAHDARTKLAVQVLESGGTLALRVVPPDQVPEEAADRRDLRQTAELLAQWVY
jgi:hypothetical protein